MNEVGARIRNGLLAGLAVAAALALPGCGTVGGPPPFTYVYGDYGYVGPWAYAPWELGGAYFVRPPYAREVGGHPGEHPGGFRPPPSIPNNPRPGGGGGFHGGGGGGGGGHSGGGGGGGSGGRH